MVNARAWINKDPTLTDRSAKLVKPDEESRNDSRERPRCLAMAEPTRPKPRNRSRRQRKPTAAVQEKLPFPKSSTAKTTTTVKKRKRRPRKGVKLGRPPRPERVGFVPHSPRPEHKERHPVHVTMRCVRNLPSLRSQRITNMITNVIRASVARGIRLLEYTIQHDHLHLMAEAEHKTKLARGMQYLFSRIALALNRMIKRKGSVFRDRHHRRVLKTPTEVRRVLVYILFNSRKHDPSLLHDEAAVDWIDEASSAMWFEGWAPDARPPPEEVRRKREAIGDSPLATAKTWLARIGWQKGGGPLRWCELPKIVL